mgnify:CR=1 FL=1
MEEKKEFTVEEIKQAANQQISLLYKKLEEANLVNAFKRLDYLFQIVNGNFPEDLKTKAIDEINMAIFENFKDTSKEE